jgi:hypothetical protein
MSLFLYIYTIFFVFSSCKTFLFVFNPCKYGFVILFYFILILENLFLLTCIMLGTLEFASRKVSDSNPPSAATSCVGSVHTEQGNSSFKWAPLKWAAGLVSLGLIGFWAGY